MCLLSSEIIHEPGSWQLRYFLIRIILKLTRISSFWTMKFQIQSYSRFHPKANFISTPIFPTKQSQLKLQSRSFGFTSKFLQLQLDFTRTVSQLSKSHSMSVSILFSYHQHWCYADLTLISPWSHPDLSLISPYGFNSDSVHGLIFTLSRNFSIRIQANFIQNPQSNLDFSSASSEPSR